MRHSTKWGYRNNSNLLFSRSQQLTSQGWHVNTNGHQEKPKLLFFGLFFEKQNEHQEIKESNFKAAEVKKEEKPDFFRLITFF